MRKRLPKLPGPYARRRALMIDSLASSRVEPEGETLDLGCGPITRDAHNLPTIYCSACDRVLTPCLETKQTDEDGGFTFDSDPCPDHPDAPPSLSVRTFKN